MFGELWAGMTRRHLTLMLQCQDLRGFLISCSQDQIIFATGACLLSQALSGLCLVCVCDSRSAWPVFPYIPKEKSEAM